SSRKCPPSPRPRNRERSGRHRNRHHGLTGRRKAMTVGVLRRFCAAVVTFLAIIPATAICAVAEEPATTGPRTETRFPPLNVPPGFKATLFACDPLVEYPSVIALGPRPGTLFVAHDYMTGLGTEIVRRDEIRLLEDSDGD